MLRLDTLRCAPPLSIQSPDRSWQPDHGRIDGWEIEAPLLALTRVPDLEIQSLSVSFTYNIQQIYNEKKETQGNVKGSIGLPSILKGLYAETTLAPFDTRLG